MENNNDYIEIYMRIYELMISNINETRNQTWKTIIVFWGFLVSILAIGYEDMWGLEIDTKQFIDNELILNIGILVGCLLGIIGIISAGVFIIKSLKIMLMLAQGLEEEDYRIGIRARDKILEIVDKELIEVIGKEEHYIKWPGFFSKSIELITKVLTVFACYAAISVFLKLAIGK